MNSLTCEVVTHLPSGHVQQYEHVVHRVVHPTDAHYALALFGALRGANVYTGGHEE